MAWANRRAPGHRRRRRSGRADAEVKARPTQVKPQSWASEARHGGGMGAALYRIEWGAAEGYLTSGR